MPNQPVLLTRFTPPSPTISATPIAPTAVSANQTHRAQATNADAPGAIR